MTDGDELLTVDEVAERVKVNPETVRRWIKSGRLSAVRPAGGPYRIHSTDLDRLFGAPPKAQAPSPPETSEEERRTQNLRSHRELLTRLASRWREEAEPDQVLSGTWLLEISSIYLDITRVIEQLNLGRDRSLYASEEEWVEAGKVFEALMDLDATLGEIQRRHSEQYQEREAQEQEAGLQEQKVIQKISEKDKATERLKEKMASEQ